MQVLTEDNSPGQDVIMTPSLEQGEREIKGKYMDSKTLKSQVNQFQFKQFKQTILYCKYIYTYLSVYFSISILSLYISLDIYIHNKYTDTSIYRYV